VGPPSYTRLEAALGTGVDPALLEQALTHRSYAYEHGGLPTNERLEFLGDAVLGLVVTDALYLAHPDLPEGQLAKLRAGVVNTRALAGVGRTLGIGAFLRLGRGEDTSGGRDKNSLLADTVEAVLGAIYLDRGLPAAAAVVRRLFDPLMAAAALDSAALDWKTALQELTAAGGLGSPGYVLTETGPDHAKQFTAEVVVAGQVLGSGQGGSKKHAEQRAARQAARTLGTGPDASAEAPSGPPATPDPAAPSAAEA
jgi:ribonuclease-3